MASNGFDVLAALRALTGHDWREDAPDGPSGILRFSAEAECRYVAEVARDGSRVGVSISPARSDWTARAMPTDFRGGVSMRGGRRRGLDWRAVRCTDGTHWRVGLDLDAVGGSGMEAFAAAIPASAR